MKEQNSSQRAPHSQRVRGGAEVGPNCLQDPAHWIIRELLTTIEDGLALQHDFLKVFARIRELWCYIRQQGACSGTKTKSDLGGIRRQRGFYRIGAPWHGVSIIGHVYSIEPLLPRDELGSAALPACHGCHQTWHDLPRGAQDRHVQLPLASRPPGVNGEFLIFPNFDSWKMEISQTDELTYFSSEN